jgi:uncharacterized protein (TIGR00290 family)
MSYALMSSGGKDSTLALDRARRLGLDVRFLANIYDGSSGRVRHHGVRRELIEAQAASLGLECIQAGSGPEEFEVAFASVLDILKARGCQGLVFGNIHLEDVRGWYERRVRARGLEHVEPLWGEPGIELVHEVVERGYRVVVVGVDLHRPAATFLGRELDADLLTEIGITDELDAAGECGEYHTFVYDGPSFAYPLLIRPGKPVDVEGHRFLDLTLAPLH